MSRRTLKGERQAGYDAAQADFARQDRGLAWARVNQPSPAFIVTPRARAYWQGYAAAVIEAEYAAERKESPQ